MNFYQKPSARLESDATASATPAAFGIWFFGPLLMCAVWAYVLTAQALVENSWLGGTVIVTLVLASVLGLRRLVARGIPLHRVARSVCALTLAWALFTFWGNLVAFALPLWPRSWPQSVRFFQILAPGVLAALASALVFAYPLHVILGRRHWIAPLLAGIAASALSAKDLGYFYVSYLLVFYKIVFELVSLVFLVPLIVHFMRVNLKNNREE